MARTWEKFDVDGACVDGFIYDPLWSSQSPMWTSLFGPGLRFVQVGLPMGTEFSLYIVCGRDSEGALVMYVTLSPVEVASMRESLNPVTVHEIRNSTLWEPILE